jgi:hypothetical protein
MAHQPRRNQARAGFRQQAERDEGRQQHRIVGRDHLIAMQQHRGADTNCGAADGRDQRFFTTCQCMQEANDRRTERAASCHRDEIVEVVAGAEDFRRTRK